MNDVIRYTATSATNDAADMFDADNFYPMDGIEDYCYDDFSGLDTDGDGIDAEFSEVVGAALAARKVGKNLKGMFNRQDSSEGSERTPKKGVFGGKLKRAFLNRKDGRDDRIQERQNKRETRRNLRQVALLKNNTPQVKQNIEKIVAANVQTAPQLRESVNLTAEGIANATQEQATQVVVQEANRMTISGQTTPPIIELNATGNVAEIKDTWWKKQNTGIKVAIIGGGVVALGLTIWGIIKIAKK